MGEKLQKWWKRFSLKQKIGVGTSCTAILLIVIVFVIQMGSTAENQKPINDSKQVKEEEPKKPSGKKDIQKVSKKAEEKDMKKTSKEKEKKKGEAKEQKLEIKEKTAATDKKTFFDKQKNVKEEKKKVEVKETVEPSQAKPTVSSEVKPVEQDNTGTSETPSKESKDENNGKTWHEAVTETKVIPAVTEQRYVVDVPARTEEVHVGEVVQASTGQQFNSLDEYYNWKDTLSDDEYVSISYSVVPKYETRTIPEQGHYETVVVTPEKKETVVIREAGWY